MGRIIILPEEVTHKIAAGEVIEGPFSVVRELIDNSIDAGATEIQIVINNGGKDFILVRDNGCGMDETDAVLSIQKHSTSKIKSAEDLLRIRTLGFRGEALSSICRVSDFQMITAVAENPIGTTVSCSFGGEISSAPCSANPGTEVRVRNLFFNLPARRKFLRSNRAEFLKVKNEIIKKAIPFYGVGFRFISDDKKIFNLHPAGEINLRFLQLFGYELVEALRIFHARGDGFEITGYITGKGFSVSNRRLQYVFVNRRPIEEKSIIYTINEAIRGFNPPARYPACFLFIDVEPDGIDVNVHPAKSEVRLKKQKDINRTIYESIRNILITRAHVGEKSEDNKVKVDTSLDVSVVDEGFLFDHDSSGGLHTPGKIITPEVHTENSSDNSNVPDSDIYSDTYKKKKGFNAHGVVQEDSSGWPEISFTGTPVNNNKETWEIEKLGKKTYGMVYGRRFSPGGSLLRSPDLSKIDFSDTHYRGSLFKKFLLFESGNSVYLVDQHAAHERIIFEMLRGEANSSRIQQKMLLFPSVITPPADMYDRIDENIEEFVKAGFDITPFGEDSFKLDAIPGFVPEKWESVVISEFFDEVFNKGFSLKSEDIQKRFLIITACRMAIKEGDSIDEKEAYWLFKELLKTDEPGSCPHGRPTVLLIDENTLDRFFFRK